MASSKKINSPMHMASQPTALSTPVPGSVGVEHRSKPKVVVVMPAYNAAKTLRITYRQRLVRRSVVDEDDSIDSLMRDVLSILKQKQFESFHARYRRLE